MRRDVTVLGKFCLNIFNIPKTIQLPNINQENNNADNLNLDKNSRNFASCFYNALKNLLTMVCNKVKNMSSFLFKF